MIRALPATLLFVLLQSASAAPVRLRCNFMTNPMGIDTRRPQLSWQSDSTARNWSQSAYQVLVATSPELLSASKPDVWDSGRQDSAESAGIDYAGPALTSARRYYWTVRVWDSAGQMAQPAAPAWFETGLLDKSDWKAQWITRADPDEPSERAALRWMWVEGHDAFAAPYSSTATFRLEFNIQGAPRNVALYQLARAASKVTVNGRPAGGKDGGFLAFDRQDVTELVRPGRNTIEIAITTPPPPKPPVRDPATGFDPPVSGETRGPRKATAVAALLRITGAGGTVERIYSGSRWQARFGASGAFQPAADLAPLSDARFGPASGTLPGAASLLRREFPVGKALKSARLYITALGSYRAFLNGRRVGADLLTPEYTEYRKRVTVQTYDVTSLIVPGSNAIAAMLGDGWFGSAMSWTGNRFMFLPPPTRLLAQLRLQYADGSEELVVSDAGWKTCAAPILHSEIYAGEVYDARLEQSGWNRPGFNAASWQSAIIAPAPPSILSGPTTEPVRVVETLQPKSIRPGPNGTQIVDMGQNMVGWIKLRASGPAGTKIRLRFAEILSPDGSLHVDNLRNANQTDAFYLRGTGSEEVFEPHFTFHGFRYVEVTGFPGQLTAGHLSGQVVSSAHTLTGKLTTSSSLVNAMWRTGIWGQRGNFVSIPTDCPQRDERMGWTGDAQVFWRTGAYNFDIAAFGHKWLHDLTDGQTEQGAFGNTAPGLPDTGSDGMGFDATGAPGWGDAGVIVPYTAWLQYGDLSLAREHWPAMERWMTFIAEGNPDLLRRNRVGANFADWLPAGSQSPRDLVATAYWAMMARQMTGLAQALGRTADAEKYARLYAGIRTAFQKEFIKPDGAIGSNSQTSILLALHMKLVPDALVSTAVENLVKDIEAHGNHLTTGFLGTPHLLFVLADHGRADVAYRLLLNETYPSWGYMLGKGATTWWERWNSDTGDPAMNSFNHYAFGSVVAWVYRYVAGIDTSAAGPGFREIIVRPRLDPRITAARAEYDSVYGKIVTDWTGTAKGPFTLKLTVPPNTRAKVYLPNLADGAKPIEVGSGSYTFEQK